MIPTVKGIDEIKLDDGSIDAIANKLMEKTDEKEEARIQLRELRDKRQNRINSNLPEQPNPNDTSSNLPEQPNLNDTNSNLPEQPQSNNIPNIIADFVSSRLNS